MAKQSKHDATDAAAGFFFQAMYGLILLLDGHDGDAVSMETGDDLERTGANPQLLQLKHSLSDPPTLTTKNDGLWNTLEIWIPALTNPGLQFVFVTCAGISDELGALTSRTESRDGVLAALTSEAQRVLAEIGKAQDAKEPKVYKAREKGCRAFLALGASERAALLKRMMVLPKTFNLGDVESEVVDRLTPLYVASRRKPIAHRLCEWWSFRVASALAKRSERTVSKEELLNELSRFAREMEDDALPDDFSWRSPGDLPNVVGSNLERQIALVAGGQKRLERAVLARWRAREQRELWIRSVLSSAHELRRYDSRLIESWGDRHGPMLDDCGSSEDAKQAAGRALLDWSHHEAHIQVPPPRSKWSQPFLAQGSLQQLAYDLQVGWHPEYLERLKEGE